GTSMVGDPTGREAERQVLTVEKINANIESIKKVYSRILRYGDGPTDAIMVNNADWLLKLNYVEFLREIGRYFSVNRMLSFDSVKTRLEREQSLTFLEFNYMIMQGYDFTVLSKEYGTTLQMGGSDQWGNIINGVDLSHKMGGPQLYAVTTPLLTKSSGEKMGKSASGAVWLNGDLFSPYDFWQYFRNTEDADVVKWLKIFTRLSLAEIDKIGALGGSEINEAKKILATEVTAIVHGREAADAAAATASATFEAGVIDLSLPTVEVSKSDLAAGIGLLNALVTAGLAGSNGEARRHVQSGAVRINDEATTDERTTLGTAAVLSEGVIKLSVGKKRHALLKPV
ncbi:MAG: tyrosine--tRNA ligase, partial [Devosia sp.]